MTLAPVKTFRTLSNVYKLKCRVFIHQTRLTRLGRYKSTILLDLRVGDREKESLTTLTPGRLDTFRLENFGDLEVTF